MGQEKVTKEKATLLGACRAAPDKSVSRGRAFRQGFLPWRKGAGIHADSPDGPVVHDSPPHKGVEIEVKIRIKIYDNSRRKLTSVPLTSSITISPVPISPLGGTHTQCRLMVTPGR
jgi:hypothetical protein